MWDAKVFHAHDGLTVAHRRAQALVEVITRGTRGGDDDGTARPLVLALIDAATLTGMRPDGAASTQANPPAHDEPFLDPFGLGLQLDRAEMMRIAELSMAGPVPTATIRRLACEGTVCPIIIGEDGNPLSMGREIRLFNRKQRRALRVRDGHCVFAGCTVGAEHCIAHHLVHWEHNGPTHIDNGALVCRFHHRLLHEGGFGLARDEHGRFVTTRPDGTPITDTHTTLPVLHRRRPPPGPDPGDDPDEAHLTHLIHQRAQAMIGYAQAKRAGLNLPRPA